MYQDNNGPSISRMLKISQHILLHYRRQGKSFLAIVTKFLTKHIIPTIKMLLSKYTVATVYAVCGVMALPAAHPGSAVLMYERSPANVAQGVEGILKGVQQITSGDIAGGVETIVSSAESIAA
ncbi:hypothetical protein BX600DRAFT_443054 [Xylariales sp. PMI_506]|nr:hypothetical protein BX600DRAFT_443054 [Xylariales sp. PMI_506]